MSIKEMIDATGFKTLLRHLDSNPDIHTIIQVHEPTELHIVGEVLADGKQSVADGLLLSGAISIYATNQGAGTRILATPPILSESQAVDCLYMPPFYLFKDLNKEWK